MVAEAVGDATLIALTMTVCVDFTTGAVNKPALVITPLFANQVTSGLLVLVKVAPNCSVPLETMLGEPGVMSTVTSLVRPRLDDDDLDDVPRMPLLQAAMPKHKTALIAVRTI
jgi:hypothetical protein